MHLLPKTSEKRGSLDAVEISWKVKTSGLSQLSDDLLTDLVSTWLDIPTIVFLDSAITNRRQRSRWHHCLSTVNESSTLDSNVYSTTSILWFLRKGCKLRKLTLKCQDPLPANQRAFNYWWETLTEVDLRGSKYIYVETVNDIVKMSRSVKILNISGCINLHYLCFLAEFCPKLEEFLAAGTSMENISACSMGKTLHELRVIDLKGCKVLDDGAIALARASPKLQHINLTDNSGITDASLLALADYCPNLISLSVGYCRRITDAGIAGLMDKLELLETIDVSYCVNLTDRSLVKFAERGRQLLHLNLRDVREITNVGISAIAHECSKLLTIDLVFCDQVTHLGTSNLAAGCPDLVIISKRVSSWC